MAEVIPDVEGTPLGGTEGAAVGVTEGIPVVGGLPVVEGTPLVATEGAAVGGTEGGATAAIADGGTLVDATDDGLLAVTTE